MNFLDARKSGKGMWKVFLLALQLSASVLQSDEPDPTDLAVEALSRFPAVDLNQNPKLKEAVLKVLA